MKARVKATGMVVEVTLHHHNGKNTMYVDTTNMNLYYEHELDFHDTLDYWDKLLHQYAGMAMQSYVSNNVYLKEIREMCKEPQEMRDLIADLSILLARTLVEKMKEERQ